MSSMGKTTAYQHTQRSPLCVLLYALAITFLVLGWVLRGTPPFLWMYPFLGLLILVLGASFHHLTVEDQGEKLLITFGPIGLFRRRIKYGDIVSVEAGRTTILDGWGIHVSLKGGWVWNIWGRDCVVIRLRNGGILRIGTDDTENLLSFLAKRLGEKE
jgi:hypothetical protein